MSIFIPKMTQKLVYDDNAKTNGTPIDNSFEDY